MRSKIRSGHQLKPGMVVRGRGVDVFGTRMDVYREVATAEKFAWRDMIVTFTDGALVRIGMDSELEMARGKTARRTAVRRAGIGPTVDILDAAAALFGVYALAAVAR